MREEQQLRETEERFRAILDNSPSVIYLKDLDGHLLRLTEFSQRFSNSRWKAP
jgi:PAS domain-containing protein